ncbi:MAG: glycerol-3-phosphate 1-O-acyltransferase PlsY [Clostridia bacterium]|nr:glycerol-3-phosphate 1-O-acyltransferase PlsY [Clostridia bacterium]
MAVYILMAIIAYAIGSVNFSVIFSKKFAGFDVREKGSGNAGSTNMLRSVGKGPALLTLICDILKGIVTILLAIGIGKIATEVKPEILVQIAGIFVVIGHTFPVYFGFRGGKGVATSLGILLLVNWQIGLICLVFALAIMILTRMVSLGSVLTAVLFPILTIFITENYIIKGNYIIFGIIMALIVIFNHRSNIKRIYNGEEHRIGQKS